MPKLTLEDLNEKIEREGDRLDELRILFYKQVGVVAMVALASVLGSVVYVVREFDALVARVTALEHTLDHVEEEHEPKEPKPKWWNPVG